MAKVIRYSNDRGDWIDFWVTGYWAAKAIVAALDEGKELDDPTIQAEAEKLRPPKLDHWECSFCTHVLEEYNKEHKTNETVTRRHICQWAKCPLYNLCKEDNRKWHVIQTLSCFWYFSEGLYFRNEGNRYPICQKLCPAFEECEAAVPTDTKEFKDLSEADKNEKTKFCIRTLINLSDKDGVWVLEEVDKLQNRNDLDTVL